MIKGEASMKQNIVYVGLDVDDTQYHGSALDKTNGEVITFKCRPTLKGPLYQLDRLHKCFPGSIFRVCYEASYIGYTLQRDLVEKGYHCDVLAFPAHAVNKSKLIASMQHNWRNSMPMTC